MKELIEEVKVYRVRLMCEECGEEMKQGNFQYSTSPPITPHLCDNGHIQKVQGKVYPHLEYR